VDGGPIRHDLVSQNGASWARQRKILNPSFATSALNNLVPLFNSTALTLMQKWEESADKDEVIDAKMGLSYFAVDVLGTAVLGKPFGAVTSEFTHSYQQYKICMGAYTNPLFQIFPQLEKIPFLPRNIKLKKAVAHMTDLPRSSVESRLEERKANGTEIYSEDWKPKDLLDFVLPPSESPNPGLSYKELLPNLWIFFLAGHDTTAISLAWTTRLLSTHPEVQAKAREEALRVLREAKERGLQEHQVIEESNIPFISAVIKESLRLYPPVHNVLTRNAAEDTVSLDHYLSPSL